MIILGNCAINLRNFLKNRGLISQGIVQGNRGPRLRHKLAKSRSKLLSEHRDRLFTCRLCSVEQRNCNASLFIRLMQARNGFFSKFLSPKKHIVCMFFIPYCMSEIIVLNCELTSTKQ